MDVRHRVFIIMAPIYIGCTRIKFKNIIIFRVKLLFAVLGLFNIPNYYWVIITLCKAKSYELSCNSLPYIPYVLEKIIGKVSYLFFTINVIPHLTHPQNIISYIIDKSLKTRTEKKQTPQLNNPRCSQTISAYAPTLIQTRLRHTLIQFSNPFTSQTNAGTKKKKYSYPPQ